MECLADSIAVERRSQRGGQSVLFVVEREVDGKKGTKKLSVVAEEFQRRCALVESREISAIVGILPRCQFCRRGPKGEPDSSGRPAPVCKKGDVITAINGQKLYIPDGVYDYVKRIRRCPTELTVERGG